MINNFKEIASSVRIIDELMGRKICYCQNILKDTVSVYIVINLKIEVGASSHPFLHTQPPVGKVVHLPYKVVLRNTFSAFRSLMHTMLY